MRSVAIGDLVESVSTWNPSSRATDTFDYVDLSAVSQTEKCITTVSSLRGNEAPSRARQLIRHEDIVVSTVRPNLNGVALVTPTFDGATASTGFCVLRPVVTKIHSSYLMHWVQSPEFVAGMVRQATGASYPAVSDRIVKAFEIPLPSLDEQRRIAAILDKADELRRKRKRALDLLDGLLSAQLASIFSTDDNFVELGDVLASIDSGWSPNCLDRAAKSGEAGNLKLSAITQNSFKPSENKAFLQNILPRQRDEIQQGDILFCRKNTRELIGSSVYVWQTPAHLYISDLIFRLVPVRELIEPVFLQSVMASSKIRQAISLLSAGAAGSMPNISKAKLREVRVPLLDLERQRHFVNFARAVHAQRGLQDSALDELNTLFASLQQRAFTGQL